TVWHDKAGNAPAVTVGSLVFPDLTQFNGDEMRQTNLIMPEPCTFLRADLPPCSVIRPASIANAGPVATIASFTADGLFKGQSHAVGNRRNLSKDTCRRVPRAIIL